MIGHDPAATRHRSLKSPVPLNIRAAFRDHPLRIQTGTTPLTMAVTSKAASSLVRHAARQQLPALRQTTAVAQQKRTRADASTSHAEFTSPFHRGRQNQQDTTAIPSFRKYRGGSETGNKVFSYFMVGAFGGLASLGAKDTVQREYTMAAKYGLCSHVRSN